MKKVKIFYICGVQRDISIFGKILIQKSGALSRLIYPAFSLNLSDSWIKDINQIQYKCIWKKQTPLNKKIRCSEAD